LILPISASQLAKTDMNHQLLAFRWSFNNSFLVEILVYTLSFHLVARDVFPK
jgi:hypothetical protein